MADMSQLNHCLSSMSVEDLELINPHLKPCSLRRGETLQHHLEPITSVFFPTGSVISLATALRGGDFIEAAMCGVNGVVGGSSAFGGKLALGQATVTVGGSAQRVDAKLLEELMGQSKTLRKNIFKGEQAITAQAQQIAACNAKHGLEPRLARRLLQVRDLAGTNRIDLTQDHVAQMLGVQRTSVSITASGFQSAGLIKYRRGRIDILDSAALQKLSCDCYEAINGFFKALCDWVPAPCKIASQAYSTYAVRRGEESLVAASIVPRGAIVGGAGGKLGSR
jgi:CRP-like cAMP-binding protein